MAGLLDSLRQLQNIERQFAEIRKTDESLERRIAAHRRALTTFTSQINERKLDAGSLQRRVDLLSLDVASREESVRKHREALTHAKTNKEYASILTALNTEKANNIKAENEALALMEQLQNAHATVVELENERATSQVRIEAVQKEFDEYKSATRADRDRLADERAVAAEGIPASALATFLRVAERHEGEAMVPLARIHPKRAEYCCGGCHMKITLEVCNALKNGDEVQFCNVCGRILYFEEPAGKR
jgi:hypothetical protein